MAVSSTSEDRLQLGFNIQQQVESDNTDIQAEVDAYLAGNVISSNGQLYRITYTVELKSKERF